MVFFNGKNTKYGGDKSVSPHRNFVDYKHTIPESRDVDIYEFSTIYLSNTRDRELFELFSSGGKIISDGNMIQNKKGKSLCLFKKSAEGGIRTHTGVSPHGPEPCASASFTTSAFL